MGQQILIEEKEKEEEDGRGKGRDGFSCFHERMKDAEDAEKMRKKRRGRRRRKMKAGRRGLEGSRFHGRSQCERNRQGIWGSSIMPKLEDHPLPPPPPIPSTQSSSKQPASVPFLLLAVHLSSSSTTVSLFFKIPHIFIGSPAHPFPPHFLPIPLPIPSIPPPNLPSASSLPPLVAAFCVANQPAGLLSPPFSSPPAPDKVHGPPSALVRSSTLLVGSLGGLKGRRECGSEHHRGTKGGGTSAGRPPPPSPNFVMAIPNPSTLLLPAALFLRYHSSIPPSASRSRSLHSSNPPPLTPFFPPPSIHPPILPFFPPLSCQSLPSRTPFPPFLLLCQPTIFRLVYSQLTAASRPVLFKQPGNSRMHSSPAPLLPHFSVC